MLKCHRAPVTMVLFLSAPNVFWTESLKLVSAKELWLGDPEKNMGDPEPIRTLFAKPKKTVYFYSFSQQEMVFTLWKNIKTLLHFRSFLSSFLMPILTSFVFNANLLENRLKKLLVWEFCKFCCIRNTKWCYLDFEQS